MTESDSNIFALPGGRSDGRVVIDIGRKIEEPVQDTKQDPDSPGEFKPKEKDESPEEIRQTVPPEPDAPDEKPRKKSKDDKSKDKDSEDKKSKDQKSDDDSKKTETPSKPSKPPRQRIDLSTIPPEVLIEKPLIGKLIAIDPGHGGSDAGAIGPSGLMEKTVTLNISLALRELLESQGAEVIMTRDTDIEVHEKGSRATANEELQARCDVANDAEADIFISVHIDSFTNSTAHGTTTYYDADSKLGFKLADKIRANLIDEIETASRGTQRCNFYVVNKTDMPATLIEVAFISNTDEEKMLGSEEGIMKAAVGIAEGIKIYFEE
ncbi:MAG: N-acetylmuramoyl-L-alanine amidase [Selenomonadaceae bacterium]|nr:N-acetylmuramoyl-L-alanine amidase [Selenomonadaceae bacterium]